jgi:hypothetical protein
VLRGDNERMGGRAVGRRLVRLVVGLALATATVGCGSAGSRGAGAEPAARRERGGPAATEAGGASPAVGSTTSTAGPEACAFGKPQVLGGLQLTVAPPVVADGPLSSVADAYPPRHGLYVTFQVDAADVGRTLVTIDPASFALEDADGARATVDTGNSPYSGVPHPLDQTYLTPGESTGGTLVFDVGEPHGVLLYEPGGILRCAFGF